MLNSKCIVNVLVVIHLLDGHMVIFFSFYLQFFVLLQCHLVEETKRNKKCWTLPFISHSGAVRLNYVVITHILRPCSHPKTLKMHSINL